MRAGAGIPKQFRLLGGVPLLARTLRAFAACPEVRRAVLVVPDPEEARRRLSAWLPPSLPLDWVRGGKTRQASTAAGLASGPAEALVLVHDGARPFVTPELVRRVLAGAAAEGAAVPLVPVLETLKRVTPEGHVIGTAPRGEFALSQTPQGFRYSVIKKVFDEAAADGFMGTDEASLAERAGHEVAVVMGAPRNIKITTPADMELAEFYLRK